MARHLPAEFHDRHRVIRQRYGASEYDLDGGYLTELAALLAEYPEDADEARKAHARQIIENANKSDERRLRRQGDLFPGDAHVALGGGRYIARDAMKADQSMRRKAVLNETIATATVHQDVCQQEIANIDEDLPDMLAYPNLTRAELRKRRTEANS